MEWIDGFSDITNIPCWKYYIDVHIHEGVDWLITIAEGYLIVWSVLVKGIWISNDFNFSGKRRQKCSILSIISREDPTINVANISWEVRRYCGHFEKIGRKSQLIRLSFLLINNIGRTGLRYSFGTAFTPRKFGELKREFLKTHYRTFFRRLQKFSDVKRVLFFRQESSPYQWQSVLIIPLTCKNRSKFW